LTSPKASIHLLKLVKGGRDVSVRFFELQDRLAGHSLILLLLLPLS
jgi:hypothetical protein